MFCLYLFDAGLAHIIDVSESHTDKHNDRKSKCSKDFWIYKKYKIEADHLATQAITCTFKSYFPVPAFCFCLWYFLSFFSVFLSPVPKTSDWLLHT